MQGNSVQLSTFKAWNFPDIGYEISESSDNKVHVVNVWCRICAKFKHEILKDARIRGIAAKELDKYVVGTKYVSKFTVLRHLKSTAHRIALEKSTTGGKGQFTPPVPQANQPRIDLTIEKASTEAYRKLLKTAYLLAVDGAPLTMFKTLVKCQKANGVKLIDKTDSTQACRLFVHEISVAIKEKLAKILMCCTSFICLTDGSQARKTGAEKELILIRVVQNGQPMFYMVSLADIDKLGESDAATLKTAIDQAFVENLGISQDKYVGLMIAATSDGASVNTGIYSGLLKRMQDDRPWLVKIHCVSHRLELAIKDSLKTEFNGVTDFMICVYYTMKQSGKLKRHLKRTGHALSAQVYSFPKVHGTRFICHQLRGVKVLLNNWIPFALALENILANNVANTSIRPKLEGFLRKLRDHRFLRQTEMYMHFLTTLAFMALKFEKDSLLVHEVKVTVERIKDSLDGLTFESKFVVKGPHVTTEVIKEGHMRRKPANREFVQVSMDMKFTDGDRSQNPTQTKKVTDSLKSSLDTRFKSFDEDIFNKMSWIDPANWGRPLKSELEDIEFVSNHFEGVLKQHDFNKDKVKDEWRGLKVVQKHFFQSVKARLFWQQICQFRRKEFPNMCLLAELILSMGVSNSVVERGFSHLTNMLNDKRLSLDHSTMEDLLLIRVNHLSWTPQQRDELVARALEIHLEKRRKRKIDDNQFNVLGVRGKKKRKKKSDNCDSSDGSDSEVGESFPEVMSGDTETDELQPEQLTSYLDEDILDGAFHSDTSTDDDDDDAVLMRENEARIMQWVVEESDSEEEFTGFSVSAVED